MLRVSEELPERDPALSQLAAAAVSGLAPAGPELRRKPRELAFAGRPGVRAGACHQIRPPARRLDQHFAGALHLGDEVDAVGAGAAGGAEVDTFELARCGG